MVRAEDQEVSRRSVPQDLIPVVLEESRFRIVAELPAFPAVSGRIRHLPGHCPRSVLNEQLIKRDLTGKLVIKTGTGL